MAKLTVVLVLGLLALTNTVSAVCDVCATGQTAACINTTAYDICLKDAKTGYIGVCDPGMICTEEPGICRPTTGYTPICKDKCNSCDGNLVACVSKTEFAVCGSDKLPSKSAISCPKKKVCNIDSFLEGKDICVDTCTNEASCSNDAAEKPDPITEYARSCNDVTDKPGVFPNLGDSSCRTYVFCEKQVDSIAAILYECPPDKKYFNKDTNLCVAERPTYCVAS